MYIRGLYQGLDREKLTFRSSDLTFTTAVSSTITPTTMSTSIPEAIKALVIQEPRKVAVVDVPTPTIDEDEILVKVVAVALNPTDYHRTYYISPAIRPTLTFLTDCLQISTNSAELVLSLAVTSLDMSQRSAAKSQMWSLENMLLGSRMEERTKIAEPLRNIQRCLLISSRKSQRAL